MTHLLFIVISLLMTLPSYSQNSNKLLGEWKIEESNENGEWILRKHNVSSEFRNWGAFFQFNEDGTFIQKAAAKCGLDDNHFNYTGKWSYNGKTKTIYLTEIKVINPRPNVYHDYKVLSSGSIQVISIQVNTLKIKVVDNWEKISKKENAE